jgi:hypothetical protein
MTTLKKRALSNDLTSVLYSGDAIHEKTDDSGLWLGQAFKNWE